MKNTALTAIATRMFTSNSNHYRVAENICANSLKVPATEIRHYYALVNKIKKSDAFAQAALDAVDWASIVSLFAHAVAA